MCQPDLMVPLVSDGDVIYFMIKPIKITEYSMFFEIYEVREWVIRDSKNIPDSFDKYLSGLIKFDGVAHLEFGENGNLSLCRKFDFDQLCKVMQSLWKYAEENIKDFNL